MATKFSTDPADQHHYSFTDADGNVYNLVNGPAYHKDNTACQGCAFTIGGSKACQAKLKPCDPHEYRGRRLAPVGAIWVQVFSPELFAPGEPSEYKARPVEAE